MNALFTSIINDYNQALSAAFLFEHDWYSLAYRCSGCYKTIDRYQLALDVCSDLMMLAADKLRSRIADITDKSQMIKFFSKCAKLTALRLMNKESFYLPSTMKGEKKCRNVGEEYIAAKDVKAQSELDHGATVADLEYVISNKSESASRLVTNKYQLAHYILENFRDNFDFCYTSLARDLNLSRSTIEAAMQVLRQVVMKLDPAFAMIDEKSRANRIRRKIEMSQQKPEQEERDNYDPYDYLSELADHQHDCIGVDDDEL